MMRLRAGPMLAAMALAWLALPQEAPAAIAQRALLLEIDGVIGPPIADYIAHEVGVARPDQVRVIIMRMNTPGGLDTSMRQIISAILASPVPVVTYVAPNYAPKYLEMFECPVLFSHSRGSSDDLMQFDAGRISRPQWPVHRGCIVRAE